MDRSFYKCSFVCISKKLLKPPNFLPGNAINEGRGYSSSDFEQFRQHQVTLFTVNMQAKADREMRNLF